jgi:hypothetical protein
VKATFSIDNRGGQCQSRYDPPGRRVPMRSANQRDARFPPKKSPG